MLYLAFALMRLKFQNQGVRRAQNYSAEAGQGPEGISTVVVHNGSSLRVSPFFAVKVFGSTTSSMLYHLRASVGRSLLWSRSVFMQHRGETTKTNLGSRQLYELQSIYHGAALPANPSFPSRYRPTQQQSGCRTLRADLSPATNTTDSALWASSIWLFTFGGGAAPFGCHSIPHGWNGEQEPAFWNRNKKLEPGEKQEFPGTDQDY